MCTVAECVIRVAVIYHDKVLIILANTIARLPLVYGGKGRNKGRPIGKFDTIVCLFKFKTARSVGTLEGILTWRRGSCDQDGSSPRARPFHCTSVGLTPAIPPNVGNSGV